MTINTLTTKVLHITMRNKAQQLQWEVQEEIRNAVKTSIEEANGANTKRMQDKMKDIKISKPHISTSATTNLDDEDLIWQALTSCKILLPLSTLLNLLPSFHETRPSVFCSR